MPVEIAAEFETPDMADFALAALRRNNVDIHSYTIQTLRRFGESQETHPPAAFNLWPAAFGGAVMSNGDTSLREYPQDVVLAVIVPDERADFARELLRGSHGLRIR